MTTTDPCQFFLLATAAAAYTAGPNTPQVWYTTMYVDGDFSGSKQGSKPALPWGFMWDSGALL